jgi:hypothetical protein
MKSFQQIRNLHQKLHRHTKIQKNRIRIHETSDNRCGRRKNINK